MKSGFFFLLLLFIFCINIDEKKGAKIFSRASYVKNIFNSRLIKVGPEVSDCETGLVLRSYFKWGSNNRERSAQNDSIRVMSFSKIKDKKRKRRKTSNNKEKTCALLPSGNKNYNNTALEQPHFDKP